MSGSQLDLLTGKAIHPPAGTYRIRLLRHEYITSGRGQMRRLVGEICLGPHSGALVYKPLTEDLLGLGWLERTAQALGIATPRVALGQLFPAYLDALVGQEAEAVTYVFAHREGPFLTMRALRRPNDG